MRALPVPGVKFAGIIHPGLIGTAPSHELLKIWNDRERGLVSGAPPPLAEVCHTRPLALVPLAKGAVLGGIKPGSADFERIAAEAARTIPGRENGGNCDIKNLSRGSKVYLPVFVEGANLSAGDSKMHTLLFSPPKLAHARCAPQCTSRRATARCGAAIAWRRRASHAPSGVVLRRHRDVWRAHAQVLHHPRRNGDVPDADGADAPARAPNLRDRAAGAPLQRVARV